MAIDAFIKQEAERLQKLIDHWCPENLRYEGMPNTLMRAFMGATACCADQKRKLDGLRPIRPLDSYPDPMVGFEPSSPPVHVWTYRVRWDQNMSGDRGITMQIQTDDWETARHVWNKLLRDALPTVCRDVVVSVDKGEGAVPFDPTKLWPRPPSILP